MKEACGYKDVFVHPIVPVLNETRRIVIEYNNCEFFIPYEADGLLTPRPSRQAFTRMSFGHHSFNGDPH